eukprot:CAMPEP_0114537610 /NCGR_PEP_ID=MMETSP0109-20121206/29673_1 /TAXON_ID=29199 /ORGANISM="Chlorarachnion reptans, Strain CCCM449" /LENGTH=865 /DNA_ID=CAMNT_0001721517 /DNA_START=146 /DNA_END=2743 /DNA_ORIENTATION=-
MWIAEMLWELKTANIAENALLEPELRAGHLGRPTATQTPSPPRPNHSGHKLPPPPPSSSFSSPPFSSPSSLLPSVPFISFGIVVAEHSSPLSTRRGRPLMSSAAPTPHGGADADGTLEEAFVATGGHANITEASIQPLPSTPGMIVINVVTSQKDARANKTRKFQRSFASPLSKASASASAASAATAPVWTSTPPVALGEAIGTSTSPSGTLTLTIHSAAKEGDKDKHQYHFVVSDAMGSCATVGTKGVHGKVILSGNLGGLSWSRDESRVAYIAEPNAPKCTNFFDAASPEDGADDAKKSTPGNAFEYKEHWGETMTDVLSPKPFVLDLKSQRVYAVKGAPKGISVGQVEWSPDNARFVCVGFCEEPRRLGLLYYNTRRSSLYLASGEESKDEDAVPWTRITGDGDHSPVNPRFSPDGKTLIYTTTEKVWYHMSGVSLRKMAWPTGGDSKAETVVPFVRTPGKERGGFPGLWLFHLPKRVWLEDSKHVVFTSAWRLRATPLVVNVDTGAISILRNAATIHADASVHVLDVVGRFVVSKDTTPLTTPKLHLATVDLEGAKDEKRNKEEIDVFPAEWSCIRGSRPIANPKVAKALREASFEVIKVAAKDDNKDFNVAEFEVLFLKPKSDQPTPVVLRPHGGPHAGFQTGFDWGNALMLSQGLAVICVNYRGSTGYGMDFLRSLPGRCGRQDVDDCISALDHVVKMSGSNVDPDRVMAWGGSHGGFLTTHLIGQFPDRFHRAATRNPVTNIAFMVTETDIPDWCYVEGGESLGEYSSAHVVSNEDIAKFYKMSPVAHAHKIKTPLLMLLGLKDLRVPPSQGLNFYRTLKARGVTTKCLTYPESTHSLSDSVRTEADVWINVIQWFIG